MIEREWKRGLWDMHHREEISILYCWKQTPGSHKSKWCLGVKDKSESALSTKKEAISQIKKARGNKTHSGKSDSKCGYNWLCGSIRPIGFKSFFQMLNSLYWIMCYNNNRTNYTIFLTLEAEVAKMLLKHYFLFFKWSYFCPVFCLKSASIAFLFLLVKINWLTFTHFSS